MLVMKINDNFRIALEDYTCLLEKKYPVKAIHELVSTRYALNHFERSILYRGITSREKAEKRREKIIDIEQLNNRTLHVDLFNVLFTIAAYLRGFPVYVAMDGMVRDASEGHESHEWVAHLHQALDLLLIHINDLNIRELNFYLDNPLELSGYMAREIERRAADLNPGTIIIGDDSPDHLIAAASQGVIATSDSTIIDRTTLPVFDLPAYLLITQFSAKLTKVEEMK